MAGRQRTFELIPTSLVRSAGSKPPMTSKAAKKAYQMANRGPRISRAEQRRLEAEELARQKREYERARVAAKAKITREKKAQKEQSEKEARKQMGLPEPSKFVRPSQPTISRFIKNGTKRTWQEIDTGIESESEGTIYDQPPAERMAREDISEDEFGDFPSLSQSDLPILLENFDTPIASNKNLEEEQELPKRTTTRLVPSFNSEEAIAYLVETQLLSKAAEAASKLDGSRSSNSSPKVTLDAVVEEIPPEPQGTFRPALRDVSANLSPLKPARITKSISFAPTPKLRLTSTKDNHRRAATGYSNIPPSATQTFLETHLDDFFPSPSQEVRELFEDIDDLPASNQITREVSNFQPIEEDTFAGLISTQDLILSSQDLEEINTPSRAASKQRVTVQQGETCGPTMREKRRFFEEKEEDLLHAALHDSKHIAGKDIPSREEDLLFAATPEIETAVERQNAKKVPLREKSMERSLQRSKSTATDYGDDEFSACDEELLALF